jgi:hypothetical protein
MDSQEAGTEGEAWILLKYDPVTCFCERDNEASGSSTTTRNFLSGKHVQHDVESGLLFICLIRVTLGGVGIL